MLNNLTVYARQQDVSRFYNEASVVLNLTNPQLAIETFGLTPLEAMTCALPVIVPTEGGIAEMVDDGVNGYKINVQQLPEIEQRITRMLTDATLYRSLAQEALAFSEQYDVGRMTGEICNVIKHEQ